MPAATTTKTIETPRPRVARIRRLIAAGRYPRPHQERIAVRRILPVLAGPRAEAPAMPAGFVDQDHDGLG